jgi:hypothetical protein
MKMKYTLKQAIETIADLVDPAPGGVAMRRDMG